MFGALGRLALKNYKPFVPVVGEAYLARPSFEQKYLYSWNALAKHIDTMFGRMQSHVQVIFTAHDPYPDFNAMARDIRKNHRMLIYTGGDEHPAWDRAANARFRAVHDYTSHLAGDHQFTLRGEMSAYNRHVKIAPPAARLALFTEIVGQTCTYFFTGGFGEQKVCKLWGFDYVNVGLVDQAEYRRNFE